MHVQVQMDVCTHTKQLNMQEKVLTVLYFNDIHLGQKYRGRTTILGQKYVLSALMKLAPDAQCSKKMEKSEVIKKGYIFNSLVKI